MCCPQPTHTPDPLGLDGIEEDFYSSYDSMYIKGEGEGINHKITKKATSRAKRYPT